tara:strand:- start:7734 stop:7940 length:207 start_codon:yes stop_codon:yes gene_type:complete
VSGIDIPAFIEAYGLAGIIIVALSFAVKSLWSQNQELQKEMRETLREVFPAMSALQTALDFIQRSGGK